jgi:hypothetical protein
MSETKLQTAAFFQPESEAALATADPNLDQSAELNASKTGDWERLSTWVSVGAAGAVVLCLAIFAITSITGIHLPKDANGLNLWLWFGGAKSDQTFEKFLKDTAAKNKRDVEANFQSSPVSDMHFVPIEQFNQSPGVQLNRGH